MSSQITHAQSSNTHPLAHILSTYVLISAVKGKDKVFYGEEPPSGESNTTECGPQLLPIIY